MLALVTVAVLRLSDLERPLAPPLVPVDAVEVARAPEVVPEVKLFAEFVDRHLLVVDADQRGFTIRQRDRIFHLADDDVAEAFALVPEARALALEAQKNLRIATALTTVGTVTASAAAVSLVLMPLFLVSGPALLAAMLVSGLGFIAMMIALPYQLTAQAQLASAVAVYNRRLLEPERGLYSSGNSEIRRTASD
jgi:hypothetical protein